MDRIKKIFIAATIGLFILTFLNACHKYPEDPFISLHRPGKRLNGTWKFIGYKINGADHNHDFDSYLNPFTLTDCKIQFVLSTDYWTGGDFYIFNGNGSQIAAAQGVQQGSGMGFNIYGWKHINVVTDSSFYGHLWQGNQGGRPTGGATWEIRELYRNNLHLSFNGSDIYFKKQ